MNIQAATAPSPVSVHASPQEWEQRVNLAACYRLVALYTDIADETIKIVQLEPSLLLAASEADYVDNSLLPLVIPKGVAHRSSMLLQRCNLESDTRQREWRKARVI